MHNPHKGIHKSYGFQWKDAVDMRDGGETLAFRSFIMLLVMSSAFMAASCLVIFDVFPQVIQP